MSDDGWTWGLSSTTEDDLDGLSPAVIESSVKDAREDMLRELPGLTPGQAVVSGDSMNTPALIQVRNRITGHGAESPDVVDEWTAAYDQRQREPTRSEAADFGEGESTGVQDLD